MWPELRLGVTDVSPAEAILFYKARDLRPQDEEDFHSLISHLKEDQVKWLRGAIAGTDPAHPWLDQLGD